MFVCVYVCVTSYDVYNKNGVNVKPFYYIQKLTKKLTSQDIIALIQRVKFPIIVCLVSVRVHSSGRILQNPDSRRAEHPLRGGRRRGCHGNRTQDYRRWQPTRTRGHQGQLWAVLLPCPGHLLRDICNPCSIQASDCFLAS